MITTLAIALLANPAVIPYEPNLRRYSTGDRWVYTLQTGNMPLHTMATDLIFVKELTDRNVFEARTTAPEGGSVPDKDFGQFVLFAQYKKSGDVGLLVIKNTSALGVQRGFKDASPETITGNPGATIHPGRWDDKPKPASSVAFFVDTREKHTPYNYVGRETVDTGFASIECAVFEAKFRNGDWMKYWFNPRIGNYVKASTSTAGNVMICLLKETSILSK
ncbi:MAG: hypothetical protein ABIV13_05210 [Fimbriimonadales bacterium]